VTGIAVVAAQSANKNGKQQEADVVGCAVGSISAYDEVERSQDLLTITPAAFALRKGDQDFRAHIDTWLDLQLDRRTGCAERHARQRFSVG